MRISEICLSLILFILTLGAFDGWQGIVPLHSTRTDVERQLGSPVAACEQTCSYKTPNESITIVYSAEPCGTGDHNRWRVPTATVVTLVVYPVIKPKLKDLKLNLKTFTKTKDPELPGYLVYTNDREGISYEVSDAGTVLSIEWFPAGKDQALSCDK
jgi:hypothetical protein